MGSNNQKQNQLLNNYKFIVNKNDSAYGDIILYSNLKDPTQTMAVIKFQSKDPEQLCKYINSKLKHPNITEIYDCYTQHVNDFCGSLNVVHVGIEYMQKSLQKDMEIRKKLRTTYFEGEIWYLIKTLCQTLYDLCNNTHVYNDLHPQNIRITDQGQLKLLELSCTPQNISSFRKVKLGYRSIDYLASEQLLELKDPQEKSQVILDQEKINIFVIGIISLVCITGLEAKEFYDIEKCIFLYGLATTKLRQYIQKYKYSQSLEEMIMKFLNYSPFTRPTYYQTINQIESFNNNLVAEHFYVKCSQLPVRLDTLNNTISKSEQKTERSPDLNQSNTGINFYSKTSNSAQTINIGQLLRTQPKVQKFSLTPERKPTIQRPQSSRPSSRNQSSQRQQQQQNYQQQNYVLQQQQYQQKTQLQSNRPQMPNYSYFDPYIDNALKKSQEIQSYHNHQSSGQKMRTSTSSTSKYTPIIASIQIQNDDQQHYNYLNVQQLIKQVNMESEKQKQYQHQSRSFTYQ